jgi:hypothetical protein
MAYNVPPTKSVGDTLADTDWNTYVRDNMIDLAARLLPTAGVQVFPPGASFTTASASYVDITGATVALTLTRQSTVVLLASGWVKADLDTYYAALIGMVNGVADTNPIIKTCANTTDDDSETPFGYTFWQTGVAAGVITVKLQLKTSNAAMTARCGNINLLAIGIPEV